MTTLPFRELKRSNIRLTEIGFGTATLGNLYSSISDDEAQRATDTAWELGVRYFDTAPHYGLGLAERRLGRALAKYPRDEFVVSTKVGRLLIPNPEPHGRDEEGFDVPADWLRMRDYSRDGVIRSLEESLDRLEMDHVDILFAHDPDELGEEAADQAAQALIELRDQQMARAVGVGTNSSAEVARQFHRTDIDIAMLAGRYTLLEQGALDSAFSAAEEHGKSIVAAGVFNSGILASRHPDKSATYNYQPAAAHLVDLAQSIEVICEAHEATLSAAAIAFPLTNPLVVSAVIGMRSAEEVRSDISLYHKAPPTSLWEDLRKRRLVRQN